MTRALRSSIYLHPNKPPTTTVILEGDVTVTDTLESLRHRVRPSGALVIHEIFETVHEDTALATLDAMRRQQANAQQEAHQAMLYYWTVLQWGRVSDRGTVLMDKPTPLSREEIAVVFDQLAQHPEYGHRTVVTPTRDGVPVVLVDGEIKEEESHA